MEKDIYLLYVCSLSTSAMPSKTKVLLVSFLILFTYLFP